MSSLEMSGQNLKKVNTSWDKLKLKQDHGQTIILIFMVTVITITVN